MERPQPPLVAYASVTAATIAGSNIVVDFDQLVMLNGIPVWPYAHTSVDHLPTAALQTADTQVTLTYAVAPVSTDVFTVFAGDAAVRTRSGRFVNPTAIIVAWGCVGRDSFRGPLGA